MKQHVKYLMALVAAAGFITGCEKQTTVVHRSPSPATPITPSSNVSTPPVEVKGGTGPLIQTTFTPPAESDIPKNEFGQMILLGKNIFVDTQQYAKSYVGNGMNCTNCHLDNGRKADSAPLWGAYGLYPAYRKKTGQVDTIGSRIQGCFRYSMNGKPPALDSKEMTALVTYHYWLAKGAPSGVKLPGQGYLKLAKPAQSPDLARGAEVYQANCALCHGANGEGAKTNGQFAFPPLWGKDSFNWGAGMHRVDIAAGFIKANMPYGRGGMLTEQQAWDVALFMNSHERPKDPRAKGSLAQARDQFHDENCLYGRTPEELSAMLASKAQTADTAQTTANHVSTTQTPSAPAPNSQSGTPAPAAR